MFAIWQGTQADKHLIFVIAEPFGDPLVLTVEDKFEDKTKYYLGRLVMPLTKVEKILLIEVVVEWHNLERVNTTNSKDPKDVKFASRICLRVSLDSGYHVFDEALSYTSNLKAIMKELWNPTIGVLELGILSVKRLLPMKSRFGNGTTDTYYVAKYGSKQVRTRTIVDSFDLNQNEQYTWEVYYPYTILTLVVFDDWNLQPRKAKVQELER